MSRPTPLIHAAIITVLALLTGCQPQEPFYLKNVDGDLSYYKGMATEIEYPDVESDRLEDVSQAKAPFSLTNRNPKDMVIWDLTLEEAMKIALTNNKVMRSIGGQIQGPPDFILRNPELIPTIYDPAIAETNTRIGALGPEAALAAFDAQFSTSLMWENTNKPQNLTIDPLTQAFFSDVNRDDLGTFQARISKIAATGAQFALTHNIAYDLSNRPTRAYPADWNVNLIAELRQPLLQGAGVQFNRIAGPNAIVGSYNGVMLARINTDIALTDFEEGVRNLVSDVEAGYWELYFQYRSLDAVIAGRDSALQTWRKIYTLYRIGGKGGEAEKEAQAKEQYYLFRSTAEESLNNLYATEAKLRYLLGLAATDGRLIRPKDEPTTAKVVFDWYEVLNESLARNTELREQKWIVKRRELELIAAKNFLLPRLDLVAQYRWLGLGNRLDGANALDIDTDFRQDPPRDTNAYRGMMSGDFQEWQTGFQMNVPIGFRREMSGVRNAQLYLARERVKLQEGELELSHQMAFSVRDLEAKYVLSQTNFNRRVAAQREVEAVAAAYETDTVTLDVLLKAQQTLAQAESDFFRSLVDYNKAISQVHFRKGSLLEYNGVYLAEGPWPAKAYFDASRRAKAREASTYLDYGFTQPRVISRGPYEQHAGASLFGESERVDSSAITPSPTPAKKSEPELVPTPEPEMMQRDEVPMEPTPAAEPQTSAAKSGNPVAKKPAKMKKIVDDQVSTVGWDAINTGGKRESRTNPKTAPANRPAASKPRVQY